MKLQARGRSADTSRETDRLIVRLSIIHTNNSTHGGYELNIASGRRCRASDGERAGAPRVNRLSGCHGYSGIPGDSN